MGRGSVNSEFGKRISQQWDRCYGGGQHQDHGARAQFVSAKLGKCDPLLMPSSDMLGGSSLGDIFKPPSSSPYFALFSDLIAFGNTGRAQQSAGKRSSG